jgi:hypothetical protein
MRQGSRRGYYSQPLVQPRRPLPISPHSLFSLSKLSILHVYFLQKNTRWYAGVFTVAEEIILQLEFQLQTSRQS